MEEVFKIAPHRKLFERKALNNWFKYSEFRMHRRRNYGSDEVPMRAYSILLTEEKLKKFEGRTNKIKETLNKIVLPNIDRTL